MLDPSPDKDSVAADNARVIALGCVVTWARAQEAWPRAPGSDILAALSAASRERPGKILVISDGLANDGDFDLNRNGFDVDPAALADSLRRANALDENLNGVEVVWTNLAESTVKIPQAVRASLRELWTFVLTAAGAKVTFDSRTAGAWAPPTDLPKDEVSIPAVRHEALPSGCGAQYVVPAALLFTPDSAVLQAGTDAVLRGVADELSPHRDWTAMVSGHTANYGTAQGRMRLSVERAEAVADALVRLGVARAQLSTRGYGATMPAVPEFRGGVHDTAAAAHNRRVVIEINATGCVR
jgi:outer membrane protein OmpA-like peptidoglycan-associated protein